VQRRIAPDRTITAAVAKPPQLFNDPAHYWGNNFRDALGDPSRYCSKCAPPNAALQSQVPCLLTL
jgi:hypothetical protein